MQFGWLQLPRLGLSEFRLTQDDLRSAEMKSNWLKLALIISK